MDERQVLRVDSLDDPRLAGFRNVKDGALRRATGTFVVEGRLNVDELLRSRRYRTRSVLVTPVAFDALCETWRELDPSTQVFVAEQETLAAVVGYDFHRGCLALAERGPDDGALDLAAGDMAPIVALEDLTDVDNVGSVFRNAFALGAAGVLLSPRCCDPLYRKAVRVSMGAVLRLPWARAEKWDEALEALRASGRSIVALDPSPDAMPLDDFAARVGPAPLVLVAGTEGDGLTSWTRDAADACVRIPMAPDADSVNVATAVAIVLQRLAPLPPG